MEASKLQQNNNNNNSSSSSSSSSSKNEHMSKTLKKTLIIINCFLLAIGDTGGPLLSRLYFQYGGHRQWLSSCLETAGWPIIFIPLIISYYYRRKTDSFAKLYFITPRIFVACVVLGLLTGLDDFLYAYGLAFIPVSTSALLISTQLAFTAFFAYIIVKQKFTPFSINAVALLTVGAVILGLHGSKDRPANVTKGKYFMGFFLTLGAAALYGFVLPMIELTYLKAKQAITYTLVMEMQLVMGFFATVFCTVGMLINGDFQAIPKEASAYGLGPVRYYTVLVWQSIFWQFFFLGAVGVIFCVHTLLAGIIIAVFIPVIEVFGVIFFHENFSSEKGVALVLSLWGLASYSYGEYREAKEKEAARRAKDIEAQTI
ncbi:purine permease 3-like [Dioscorea cayenensis subsp. rotundata]|uniref:Probable purine permease n=1 Tax=Dioscorea cayennensis subsp. rotundata TaxID=55577 RepID=A0AB40CYS6_DIOCR|nr:purine permease 3-like [Dioscorea cayenensis subsp. rotundata]XP_039145235.1 purine permease 3-like [Dioscorea cayenensis subsp. rotundata]